MPLEKDTLLVVDDNAALREGLKDSLTFEGFEVHLVEKETALPAERTLVASVFHNRLKKNMKLDCDPTVRYATRKFTGRIGYRDLAYNSPFNTYLYRGLPPTPICSPGLATIEAALQPAESDYLYFVSRNDGSHIFSETYAQHLKGVQQFQKSRSKK